MVWFIVDDGLSTSPKVLSIPRSQRLAAMGLWAVAGSWCGKHLTDGKVPGFMLEEWGADVSLGTCLVDARLWVKTTDGYRFHDWAAYQQVREDVETKRERERERKKAYREKRAGQKGESPTGTDAGTDAGQERPSRRASGTPNQAKPSQAKPVKEGGAARGSRIPDPFLVSTEMRAWAAERAPLVNVDLATERFVNYWRAKSGKDASKIDWKRTWNNWLLSDQEKAEQRGPKATPSQRAMATIALGQELQFPRAVEG
ncbi:MAG: hypothetical protein WED09_07330 [Homoserinimonas sp.]